MLKNYHVSKIGLFGSFVTNTANDASDIDLVVDFDEPIDLFDYVGLSDSISSFFNKKVDLVTIAGIKPFYKDSIMEEVEWIEGRL